MGFVRYTMGPTLAMLVLSAGAPRPGSAQSSIVLVSETVPNNKSVPALERPARLMVRNVPLLYALTRLYETSGVPVSFSPSLLPRERIVSCACQAVTVSRALDLLLSKSGLRYREFDDHVLVYRVGQSDIQIDRPDIVQPRYASFNRLLQPRTVLQEGTVTGSVVEGGSLRPLAGVQVHIPGSSVGTLTNAAGRYILSNVPAGQVTIRAQMIGFGTEESTVTLSSGESVALNFELTQEALALDEVIVTGTPGGTERRAIGNAVSRIAAGSALEIAPNSDAQQIMAFKSPGVSVLPAQGEVGSGGAIRIRGSSTLGLSSAPVVYIDGIRMNSDFGGPPREGGGNMSRINDINPRDIESIEIIKGPAAATLYGTEASAGVIQIITKGGFEGEPRFDFSVGQGATWFQSPAERLGESFALDESGTLISVNLYEHEAEHGLGPVFQTGNLQNYSASVTGGTARVRYFGSANWEDETGIVDSNWLERLTTRANLSVLPRQDLTFSLNSSYTSSTTAKWQGFPDDIYRALLWGGPDRLDTRTRGFNRRTPEALRDETERLGRVNRVITALAIDHVPTSWLTHRLNVGFDVTNEDNSRLVRRSPDGAAGIFGANSLGVKLSDTHRHEVISVDYSGTASVPLTDEISSSTSVGAQYFRRSTQTNTAEGRIFPAPGFETIGSAAITAAGEDFFENATLGSYVQQQFGWRDRLFVTGALRVDDNSAFGVEFDGAVYPKLSATWVVHEEAFWNVDWISRLRLRSAWGAAGRQPDVFDAPRLYESVTGPGDQPGITPSSFGNPALKPERSKELEVGFDAAFLNDRIELGYTYYTKDTRDAIVPVPIAPSLGFPGTQVLNVGALSNWGHEFNLTARVVDRPGVGWDLGAQSSLLRDRVDDIGPVDFIHVGDSRSATQHRVGYPSQSVFFWRILSADLHPDGTTSNEMCDGGTGPDGHRPGGPLVPCEEAPLIYWGRGGNPTWEASLWTALRLGRIRFYAQADGRGGHMFMENDNAAAHTSFTNTSLSNLQTNAVFQAYRKIGREALAFSNAGFVRLRNVSATYDLPIEWAQRVGGSRASITVSGRNLALLWQEQKYVELPDGSIIPDPQIKDPERRFTGEVGTFHQALMPPLASVMATIRVSF